MARVRVSVPATVNNFGPGIDTIGLAVRLYETIELTEAESGFHADIDRLQSAEEAASTRRTLLSTIRALAHKTGRTPSGLRSAITQGRLAGHGLGLEVGIQLGCAAAANVLAGGALSRDELLKFVLTLSVAGAVSAAAFHGNLAVAASAGTCTLFSIVPVMAQEVILIAPKVRSRLESVQSMQPAASHATLTALLVDALRTGNHGLLHELSVQLIHDRELLPGYTEAIRAAESAGASSVFVHANGLSAVAFARSKHKEIGAAMSEAFEKATGMDAETWTAPIETHGISIDAVDVAISGSQPTPVPVGLRQMVS